MQRKWYFTTICWKVICLWGSIITDKNASAIKPFYLRFDSAPDNTKFRFKIFNFSKTKKLSAYEILYSWSGWQTCLRLLGTQVQISTMTWIHLFFSFNKKSWILSVVFLIWYKNKWKWEKTTNGDCNSDSIF